MTITELMPTLQKLNRGDKLRVVQFLVHDLAVEEGVSLFEAQAEYPVWTPYGAHEAAGALLRELGPEYNHENE